MIPPRLHLPTRKNTMPQRAVRVRRHRDGHFEFLEPVNLPEPEFEVIVNEPTEKLTASSTEPYILPERDLGPVRGTLSRSEIYDDILS